MIFWRRRVFYEIQPSILKIFCKKFQVVVFSFIWTVPEKIPMCRAGRRLRRLAFQFRSVFTGVNESTEIWSSRETIVESHAGWYTCCFSMEFSFFIALSDSPLLVEVLGLVGITHQKLNIEIPGSAHFDILLESGFLYKE